VNLQTKILIPLILVFSLMTALVIWINFSNQKIFVEQVIDSQATQTAYQYFDSVNTMMITGTMENREILRRKLMENKNILDAHLVRNEPVKKLFGPGFPYESAKDELDARALKGEVVKVITEDKSGRSLTVLVPFKASTNYRGTNCIECHQVEAGTVLGAARITYSLSEVDSKVKENAVYVGKILAALFTIALIIVVIFLRLVAVNKLKKFNNSMEYIAQKLDLTLTLSQPNKLSGDEISKMAGSFDHMIGTIRHSLSQVKNSTDKIVMGTAEISSRTNDTMADIREQKEETAKVAQTLGKMTESSLNVASNTSQSQQFTNNVEAEVSDGADKAHSAREKINHLYKQIEMVATIAEKLAQETLQISSTVKIIDDITLKTKLLSFNASVEAARAGETGKGFAVVANEIGQLANQTKQSNLEIEKATVALKNLMEEAVAVIRETKLLAEEGKNEVNISYVSFKNVSIEMVKLKEVMSNIAESTQEQSRATKAVEKNITSIIELSNKTTTASERIGEVSADFSNLAKHLEKLINQFKI
jgi:methyl-accepting chemotaxis protein